MANFEFKLPDIGEGIAEAEIVAWHVAVGDRVQEDQQIADMMTDKATVEMESPVAGTVRKLAGEVGDQIAIGSVLVEIETDRETGWGLGNVELPQIDDSANVISASKRSDPVSEIEPETLPTSRKSEAFEASEVADLLAESNIRNSADTNSVGGSPARVLASPALRQRARDLGIDLGAVSVISDRLRHSDLDAYLLYNGGSVSRSTPRRPDESHKVVGLRRKIAENMAESKRRIPHFTLVEEFDVTELEATRAMMNRDRGELPKLTILPFMIVAIGKALIDWPMLNSTFNDDTMRLTRHGAMHLGMATQTPGGLMVPVIRDAQAKTVWQLAGVISRLAEAARSGKATRDELTGSTITLSSLGPMGGITSTPVINSPEVAIIAVNKVQELPVVHGGQIMARRRMNLSLSCDHRVVDGWDAASFLQALKPLIENPLRLLSA